MPQKLPVHHAPIGGVLVACDHYQVGGSCQPSGVLRPHTTICYACLGRLRGSRRLKGALLLGKQAVGVLLGVSEG
jgi:hypothetical protein